MITLFKYVVVEPRFPVSANKHYENYTKVLSKIIIIPQSVHFVICIDPASQDAT